MTRKFADAVSLVLFLTTVLALEMVARGRRESWWGWLLYLGSAISLIIAVIARVAIKESRE